MVLTVNHDIVEPVIENVPDEMYRLNNWVVWKAVESDKVNENGERVLDKVLKRTNGLSASSTDPKTWTDFHTAYNAYINGSFAGIGFVFEKNNKIIGLDLDGHFEDGQPLTEIAQEITEQTFVEISPSGTGAHAYFIGDLPDTHKHVYQDNEGQLELFNNAKFFTFTGEQVGQDELSSDQSYIDKLVDKYFYKAPELKFETARTPNVLPTDEVIKKMLKNEKVKDLFEGNTSKHNHDNSSADLALCNHLAFWTGKNPDQMDEIFRQSELMRDKWDNVHSSNGDTYGMMTIKEAIKSCRSVYKQSVINPDESKDYVWDEIVSFDADDVLPFPKNIFPDWLEEYIDQVAMTTQTPREMAAMGAFTTLSVATAKKFEIEIYDGWVEPLNTYLLTLMPPASRKSQVFKDMTQPIADYQKEQRELLKGEISRSRHEIDIKEKRIEALKRSISNPTKGQNVDELQNELLYELDNLEEMEEVTEPTYIADDVTSEVLEQLLKQNDERMAIVSPEGGMFSNMRRYSDNANLDVFLKGHPAERLSAHRLSRDAVELEAPHLTVGIFAQPSVIQEVPKEFFQKGLMARFLFSLPKDNRGQREIRPRKKDPTISSLYYDNIKSLMRTKTDGITLKLSREADMHVQLLQEEIEMRQGYKEDLRENEEIESWSGKLIGQLMRLAGLIHMSKVLGTSDFEVQADTIQSIERLKDYFISHAKKAFDVSGVDSEIDDTKYLIEKILEFHTDGELKRQILWQNVKKKFNKSSDLKRSLEHLIDRSYIKVIERGTGRGRPSEWIILNPNLYQ